MALDFRGIGVNLQITAANAHVLDDPERIKAAIQEVNDRNLYDSPSSKTMMPGRVIQINGVPFRTQGDVLAGGLGAVITVADPTGQRYKLKRVFPLPENPVPPTVKEFLIGHLVSQAASLSGFPAAPGTLKPYWVVKGGRRSDSQRPYYALLEEGGQTLERYLTSRPNQTLSCFKTIATQIQSLQASNQFVHADLKPNNILLDANGHLRIIDFGFSRVIQNGVTVRTKSAGDYNNWRDLTHLAIGIAWLCNTAYVANAGILSTFLQGKGGWPMRVLQARNPNELYLHLLPDGGAENVNALPSSVLAALARYPLYNPPAAPSPPSPFGSAPPPPPPAPPAPGALPAQPTDDQLAQEIQTAYMDALRRVGTDPMVPGDIIYGMASRYVIREVRADPTQPLRTTLTARLTGIRSSATPVNLLYFDACGSVEVEFFSIRGATAAQKANIHQAIFRLLEPTLARPYSTALAQTLLATITFLRVGFTRVSQEERTDLLSASSADRDARLQAILDQGQRGVGRRGPAGLRLRTEEISAIKGCACLFGCAAVIWFGGPLAAVQGVGSGVVAGVGAGGGLAIGLVGKVLGGAAWATGGGIQVVGQAIQLAGQGVGGAAGLLGQGIGGVGAVAGQAVGLAGQAVGGIGGIAGRAVGLLGEGIEGAGALLGGIGGGQTTRKRKLRGKRAQRRKTRSGWRGKGGRTLVRSEPPVLNQPFEVSSTLKRSVNRNGSTKTPDAEILFDYDLPSEYSYDFFLTTSVEYLFDHLRFDVFPSESEEEVRELITDLFYVACRDPPVLKTILSLSEAGDLQGLRSFAREARAGYSRLEELFLEAFGVDAKLESIKNPQAIVEAYLRETNRRLSLRLLQTLVTFDVTPNPKALATYVNDYESIDPRLRLEKLGAYDYDGFGI
jgi:hypothetical protein